MVGLDERIINIVGKFFKRFMTRKVLKTTEEVEANTNEANLVSALVVGELINNLGGVEFIFDDAGKIIGYKSPGGADTVFPFSISGTLAVKLLFDMQMNTQDGTEGNTAGAGTVSLSVTISDGKITNYSCDGRGSSTTVGGRPAAYSCTTHYFKITSITWTPA